MFVRITGALNKQIFYPHICKSVTSNQICHILRKQLNYYHKKTAWYYLFLFYRIFCKSCFFACLHTLIKSFLFLWTSGHDIYLEYFLNKIPFSGNIWTTFSYLNSFFVEFLMRSFINNGSSHFASFKILFMVCLNSALKSMNQWVLNLVG